MPTTLESAIYLLLSSIIVLGLAIISWLLNKGFDSIKCAFDEMKDELIGIRKELSIEHDERIEIKAELKSMRVICDDRHQLRRSSDHACIQEIAN